MVAAELQAADILHRTAAKSLEVHGTGVITLGWGDEGIDRRRVDPIVAEIVEAGVKVFEIQA